VQLILESLACYAEFAVKPNDQLGISELSGVENRFIILILDSEHRNREESVQIVSAMHIEQLD